MTKGYTKQSRAEMVGAGARGAWSFTSLRVAWGRQNISLSVFTSSLKSGLSFLRSQKTAFDCLARSLAIMPTVPEKNVSMKAEGQYFDVLVLLKQPLSQTRFTCETSVDFP
jgi:hypothetical protein